MRIITQAIRVIDYENNKVLPRDIMPKFGEYIEQLISYINGNTSIREYKTQSVGGEVISSILEIVENRSNEEIILQRIDMMAERLLRKEREAQEQVASMDIKVQKGSLILSLIEHDENLLFLLAKVEHTDFSMIRIIALNQDFQKIRKRYGKHAYLKLMM